MTVVSRPTRFGSGTTRSQVQAKLRVFSAHAALRTRGHVDFERHRAEHRTCDACRAHESRPSPHRRRESVLGSNMSCGHVGAYQVRYIWLATGILSAGRRHKGGRCAARAPNGGAKLLRSNPGPLAVGKGSARTSWTTRSSSSAVMIRLKSQRIGSQVAPALPGRTRALSGLTSPKRSVGCTGRPSLRR